MSYQSSEPLQEEVGIEQPHSGLQAHVDAVGDAIISVDRDGRFVLWNPGAERLFGFSADDVLGESLDLIIPSDSRKAHWDGFNEAMRTNQTRLGTNVIRVPMLRQDKSLFSGALAVGIVRGEGGRIEQIGAIIRDDTRD